MKINNFFRGAFFLGAAALLAGCVTTQGEQAGAQLGEAIGRAITGAPPQPRATTSNGSSAKLADPRRGIRSIGETELAGLFNSKPLRMPNGRSAQYPRVAITVDDHLNEMTKVPRNSQCYFMHARIWDSQTKSHDVGPFSVCGSDIKEPTSGFLRSDSTIDIWNSGIASAGEDHSGSARTEGPRYPQRPIPSGPLDAVLVTPSHNAFYFVHGTLTTMNFDFTQTDPRVWFVKFGKLDAAGFQAYQESAKRQAKASPKVEERLSPSPAVTTPAKTVVSLDAKAVSEKRPAGPVLTYDAMIKVMREAKGIEQTVKKNLVGRSIQLSLKVVRQLFVVKAGDEITFNCVQKAPGFKGGKITAVITDYVEEGDATSVSLDRCQ